jgi:hypothetical protein
MMDTARPNWDAENGLPSKTRSVETAAQLSEVTDIFKGEEL